MNRQISITLKTNIFEMDINYHPLNKYHLSFQTAMQFIRSSKFKNVTTKRLKEYQSLFRSK